MTVFAPEVVGAVLHHMNDDHTDDNLLIVRAFTSREPDTAVMIDLDHLGGTWRYTIADESSELHLPWSHELGERAEIRREIVTLYRAACTKLGIEPRQHE